MNYQLILKMLGRTLMLESACLLLPLVVTVYYGESPIPFLCAILVTAFVGYPLSFVRAKGHFFVKEGFVVGSAMWLFFCVFGALPFLFSGYFGGYANCFFEIVSGFTTTGASILSDVESLPRGILLWRSFSSWLGGMGVLIFALAFLPSTDSRIHNLARTEVTGPVTSKLVPKTSESYKILYTIYALLTAAEILCLHIIGKMPWFDAILHSFTTICTGGFSIKNASIGSYDSVACEYIVAIFILLSTVNFATYFLLYTRRAKNVLQSDELRYFLGIVAVATGLITLNLAFSSGGPGFAGFEASFRAALFQVSSIMSTTGFSTVDYNLWPEFSKIILVLLMFVGGCAGSTAGGIKVSRMLLVVRCIQRDVRKVIHPRAIKVAKLDGNGVDESVLRRVSTFFACWMLITAASCLLVSLDNFSFATTTTAVISAMGNVGPGLDMVGPMGNYGAFSSLSKVVLSFCMLVGRLEIFPVLVLLSPSTWRRSHL